METLVGTSNEFTITKVIIIICCHLRVLGSVVGYEETWWTNWSYVSRSD